MYLELLKKTLSYSLWEEPLKPIGTNYNNPIKTTLAKIINRILVNTKFRLGNKSTDDSRINGEIHPVYADTMIGMKRLDNIQFCVEDVLQNNIPGDFIETGVWRGGACIFMKGILKIHEVTDRKVFVADSFEGLPKTDKKQDGWDLYKDSYLAVSQEQVENNFKRYDLLDSNVIFLKGWFKDTLPTAPINKLAILRLDGDLYESTMDSLMNLYPKLSTGGYCIIDDYTLSGCREAVHEYRKKEKITSKIIMIDRKSCYWKSQSPYPCTHGV